MVGGGTREILHDRGWLASSGGVWKKIFEGETCQFQ